MLFCWVSQNLSFCSCSCASACLLAHFLSWEWISFWSDNFCSCTLLAFYSALFKVLFNVLFKMTSVAQTCACIELNAINNAELCVNAQNILTLTHAEQSKNTSLIYKSKQKKFQIDDINLVLALTFWLMCVFFSRFFVNKNSTVMTILLQKRSCFSFLLKKWLIKHWRQKIIRLMMMCFRMKFSLHDTQFISMLQSWQIFTECRKSWAWTIINLHKRIMSENISKFCSKKISSSKKNNLWIKTEIHCLINTMRMNLSKSVMSYEFENHFHQNIIFAYWWTFC